MKYSVPLILTFAVMSTVPASGAPLLDFYSDYQGWVNSAGEGNGGYDGNNTFTGNEYGFYYNSWASFDLTGLSGVVTSAELRVTIVPYPEGALTPYDLLLYNVSTPLSSFLSSTSGGTGYNDLGSGNLYGDIYGVNTSWTLTLSAQAVADINIARGGAFLIGFTNFTLNSQDPTGVDIGTYINGFRGDPNYSPQLKLETVPETVPEPSTLVLLGAGLGMLGLATWRRNH